MYVADDDTIAVDADERDVLIPTGVEFDSSKQARGSAPLPLVLEPMADSMASPLRTSFLVIFSKRWRSGGPASSGLATEHATGSSAGG